MNSTLQPTKHVSNQMCVSFRVSQCINRNSGLSKTLLLFQFCIINVVNLPFILKFHLQTIKIWNELILAARKIDSRVVKSFPSVAIYEWSLQKPTQLCRIVSIEACTAPRHRLHIFWLIYRYGIDLWYIVNNMFQSFYILFHLTIVLIFLIIVYLGRGKKQQTTTKQENFFHWQTVSDERKKNKY